MTLRCTGTLSGSEKGGVLPEHWVYLRQRGHRAEHPHLARLDRAGQEWGRVGRRRDMTRETGLTAHSHQDLPGPGLAKPGP